MNFIMGFLFIFFVVLVVLKATVLPLLAWTTIFLPLVILGIIVIGIIAFLIWLAGKLKGRW